MEGGLNCNNQIVKLDSNEGEDWVRGKTNNLKFLGSTSFENNNPLLSNLSYKHY